MGYMALIFLLNWWDHKGDEDDKDRELPFDARFVQISWIFWAAYFVNANMLVTFILFAAYGIFTLFARFAGNRDEVSGNSMYTLFNKWAVTLVLFIEMIVLVAGAFGYNGYHNNAKADAAN